MNQGKIWLVVKPTVGLPAFLGSVALISLCVHTAVLTKSDWFPAFINGNKAKPKVAEVAPATPGVASANAAAGATVLAAATVTDIAATSLQGSPPKK